MRTSLQGWLVLVVLLGTTVYAIAEEFTLTTYYPSPRGVYEMVRAGLGTVLNPSAHVEVAGNGSRALLHGESGGVHTIIYSDGALGVGLTQAQALAAHPTFEVGGVSRLHDNLEMEVGGSTVTLSAAGGNLTIDTSATNDALVLTSSGNLGIGQATPTQRLHVAGNGLFTGTLIIEGGAPDTGKVWSATDTSGNGTWDYPKYAP
jgi:hypothetical protein